MALKRTALERANPPDDGGFFVAEMEEHRECRCCHARKPVTLFAKANGRTVGICKACDAARYRDYYARNREARCEAKRKQDRDRYWKNPEAVLATHRTPHHRAINRASVERYKANNPERVAAHKLVRYAVARGAIVRPSCCQALGCERPAQAMHHSNYDRPLVVDHLCTRCHGRVHAEGKVELKPGLTRRFARAPKPPKSKQIERAAHQKTISRHGTTHTESRVIA